MGQYPYTHVRSGEDNKRNDLPGRTNGGEMQQVSIYLRDAALSSEEIRKRQVGNKKPGKHQGTRSSGGPGAEKKNADRKRKRQEFGGLVIAKGR